MRATPLLLQPYLNTQYLGAPEAIGYRVKNNRVDEGKVFKPTVHKKDRFVLPTDRIILNLSESICFKQILSALSLKS